LRIKIVGQLIKGGSHNLKYISECKSQNCSATNPRVVGENFEDFPQDVQDKLNEMDLKSQNFRRCTYCGNIWYEYWSDVTQRSESKMIGVKPITGEMIWQILK